MDIVYREATESDVPGIADVFLTSLGDMLARNGVKAPLPPRPATEVALSHLLKTGDYYVAEKPGRIVSIGGSIVRDKLWFLSSFWTLPEHQRQRIGRPLLELLWDKGRKAGAEIYFVWSSMDLAAMALYMRMGMLPGYQILVFKGVPRDIPPKPSGYEVRPLEKSVAMRLDNYVRGTPREPDHAFWLGQGGALGREVLHGDEVAGYYYITKAGVGPMSWISTRHAEPMLTLALLDAQENNGGDITLSIPGLNHDAVRFSLRTRLQLLTNFHLLTTGPFGRLDQYVSSGPSLF